MFQYMFYRRLQSTTCAPLAVGYRRVSRPSGSSSAQSVDLRGDGRESLPSQNQSFPFQEKPKMQPSRRVFRATLVHTRGAS